MFFLFPRLEHTAGWICARYKSLLLLLLVLGPRFVAGPAVTATPVCLWKVKPRRWWSLGWSVLLNSRLLGRWVWFHSSWCGGLPRESVWWWLIYRGVLVCHVLGVPWLLQICCALSLRCILYRIRRECGKHQPCLVCLVCPVCPCVFVVMLESCLVPCGISWVELGWRCTVARVMYGRCTGGWWRLSRSFIRYSFRTWSFWSVITWETPPMMLKNHAIQLPRLTSPAQLSSLWSQFILHTNCECQANIDTVWTSLKMRLHNCLVTHSRYHCTKIWRRVWLAILRVNQTQ